MTTALAKFQLGAAALGMAAAAAVVPVVAQADTVAPLAPSLTSVAKAVGAAAGSAVCDVTSGDDCTAAVLAGNQANALGALGGILQNNVIWFGEQNPNFWNSADTVEVWTFTPLNAILWAKPYLPGLWTWFESRDQQTCFLGITTALGGPYSPSGTYTHSYNHGGCNPS